MVIHVHVYISVIATHGITHMYGSRRVQIPNVYAFTCELKSLFAFCLFADRSFRRLLLPRGLCMYVSLRTTANRAHNRQNRRSPAAIFSVPFTLGSPVMHVPAHNSANPGVKM